MKKIAIIVPFFGKWPEWFPLTLESIRWNPTIHWYFFTDCGVPENAPENAHFKDIEFSEYCNMVSQKLGIDFKPKSAYKLCDLKPSYGLIHEEILSSYDYWGWSDIDLVFGNLGDVYTDELLSANHSCISERSDFLSGSFCIFPNRPDIIRLYQKMSSWRTLICDNANQVLDEYYFTRKFLNRRRFRMIPFINYMLKNSDLYKRNAFFFNPVKQIELIEANNKSEVCIYWKDGNLFTKVNGQIKHHTHFHFVHWKSCKYEWVLKKQELKKTIIKEQVGCWEHLQQINNVSIGSEHNGFKINIYGIFPI